LNFEKATIKLQKTIKSKEIREKGFKEGKGRRAT
jgi:hypothetical protein